MGISGWGGGGDPVSGSVSVSIYPPQISKPETDFAITRGLVIVKERSRLEALPKWGVTNIANEIAALHQIPKKLGTIRTSLERRHDSMKKILFSVAILAIPLILVLSLVTPVAGISWGNPDGVGHPNVCAVLVDVDPDPGTVELQAVASGTLIASKVVLTAGHVTAYLEAMGIEAKDVFVTFDPELDLPSLQSNMRYDVDSYVTPDQYFFPWSIQAHPYDVGILILSEDLSIVPAKLPS